MTERRLHSALKASRILVYPLPLQPRRRVPPSARQSRHRRMRNRRKCGIAHTYTHYMPLIGCTRKHSPPGPIFKARLLHTPTRVPISVQTAVGKISWTAFRHRFVLVFDTIHYSLIAEKPSSENRSRGHAILRHLRRIPTCYHSRESRRLVHEAPQGPDIGALVVALFVDQLRRHVVRGAHARLRQLRAAELLRQPEVSQLFTPKRNSTTRNETNSTTRNETNSNTRNGTNSNTRNEHGGATRREQNQTGQRSR